MATRRNSTRRYLDTILAFLVIRCQRPWMRIRLRKSRCSRSRVRSLRPNNFSIVKKQFTETDGGAENCPVVRKNILDTDGGPVVVVEQMCHSLPMVPFEQTKAGYVLSQCDTPRHRRHEGHQQHDGLVKHDAISLARDEGTHWAGAQRPKTHSRPVERPEEPTHGTDSAKSVYTRCSAKEGISPSTQGSLAAI